MLHNLVDQLSIFDVALELFRNGVLLVIVVAGRQVYVDAAGFARENFSVERVLGEVDCRAVDLV